MIYGLGERLREQRMLKNLSQKEVADIINVSPSIVSNYERSERVPSLEILVSLAPLYQCSTDYLLGFQTAESDNTLDVSMLSREQKMLLQKLLSTMKS